MTDKSPTQVAEELLKKISKKKETVNHTPFFEAKPSDRWWKQEDARQLVKVSLTRRPWWMFWK
jgi:hypothetical protein